MSSPEQRSGWSLHRRLALGLVIGIGGAFIVLFTTLDIWIDREIYRQMDTALMQRATAVGRVLQESDPAQLERLMPEYAPVGHTEFFTLFDTASGQVILRSPNSAGQALAAGPTQQGTPRYYDVRLPDGHAGRAVAIRAPSYIEHVRPRTLVVATERESWNQTEARVHHALAAGIALATLLATGLALLLVQQVILTLRRAGKQAAALRADTPDQRIEGDFPRELRPFTEAFNSGLHHLYTAIERERRFSRDVAHELRTPLAEIRASAEGTLADSDPAQTRRSLHAVIDASARMQRSVDTLLLLARLEAGQHIAAPDPLDLSALLRESLAAQHEMQAARRLEVRSTLPASAWVRSDQGAIERILSNLLRNAFEYSPEDAEVSCRLELVEAGWQLTIDNAAPELEPADLEHFGHRFWRKESAGSTAHHAGLGLALAFALAQAIGLPLHFDLQAGRLTARLGPWPALL